MAKAKAASSSDSMRQMRPALTPEARESQCVSMAMDLAERQIREGTASSQVITHFLKLGSTRERLEREKLEKENELLRAKTESLQSMQRIEELYSKAMMAFSDYDGHGQEESEDDY